MSSDHLPLSGSRSLLDKATLLVATGFGAGRLPAPGTFGAIWGIPLTWFLMEIPTVWVRWAVIGFCFFVGVPICTRAAKLLGAKDPGQVVWDEIASMPIVFLLLPSATVQCFPVLLIGFLLHRVFDISKPPPISRLEKLPRGWGIMADDVLAALFANVIMQVLYWAGLFAILGG